MPDSQSLVSAYVRVSVDAIGLALGGLTDVLSDLPAATLLAGPFVRRVVDALDRALPDDLRGLFRPYIRSVSPKRLAELERIARRNLDFPLRSSLLTLFEVDLDRLVDRSLTALNGVLGGTATLGALVEGVFVVPNPVLAGDDDDDVAPDPRSGGHLRDAPEGVGAVAAWAATRFLGPNGGPIFGHPRVALADVEESWIAEHEEFGGRCRLIHGVNVDPPGSRPAQHGTQVLGVTSALRDGRGVTGVCPDVPRVLLASCVSENTRNLVADAIVAAVDELRPGDVLLVEESWLSNFEKWDYLLPAEFESACATAIGIATGNGIIVVEAAGNTFEGRVIDRVPRRDGTTPFDPVSAIDTGAIVVGSSRNPGNNDPLPHRSLHGSRGSRVDCFAQGDGVSTAGGGNIAAGAVAALQVTNQFGGTSAAAAIVAGCALWLQSVHRTLRPDSFITPKQMRSILSTGTDGNTRSSDPANDLIGRMPNLPAILREHPDLFPLPFEA